MLDEKLIIQQLEKREKLKSLFMKILYWPIMIFFPDEKSIAYYKFFNIYNKKKFKEAAEFARNYLKSDPKNNKMKIYLAYAYTELKKHNAALQLIQEFIKKSPENKYVLFIYIHNLSIDKLINIINKNEYKKFVNIPEFYQYTLHILIKHKKINEAKKLIFIAKNKRIDSWYIYYSDGYIYDLSKMYLDAIKMYKLAIKKKCSNLYKKFIKKRIKELEEKK